MTGQRDRRKTKRVRFQETKRGECFKDRVTKIIECLRVQKWLKWKMCRIEWHSCTLYWKNHFREQWDWRFWVPWTRIRVQQVLFSILLAHLPYEEDALITTILQMVKLGCERLRILSKTSQRVSGRSRMQALHCGVMSWNPRQDFMKALVNTLSDAGRKIEWQMKKICWI